MKSFFLYKVYQHSKKLFFFFIIFAVFTLFCNLIGVEVTPFYVWGMYSQKEETPKEYPIFRITANDKLIDYSTGYFPANRFFLLSPLSYYGSIKTDDPTAIFLKEKLKEKYENLKPYANNVLNSPKEVDKFPGWYKRYVEQTTGEEIKNLKVELLLVSYENDYSITVNSVHTLINE
ncbi:MAG: hypothetical protein ABI374_11905 [Ginsengibacter sp.]